MLYATRIAVVFLSLLEIERVIPHDAPSRIVFGQWALKTVSQRQHVYSKGLFMNESCFTRTGSPTFPTDMC
jgi:hypothetical protein